MLRDLSALEAALADLDSKQLRRRRLTVDAFVDADSAVRVRVEGRTLLNFSSNDYLGLSRHPMLCEAMSACALSQGSGSAAAHLISGHAREHAALETEIAAFVGRERALLLSTGYMANLAAITVLASRGERLFLDRLNHASLIDAALLSGARFRRYPHGDFEALSRMLAGSATAAAVASDGVFSMDGDLAPLAQLASTCRQNRAGLIVDDAHGLGVLGAGGRGTLEHFHLNEDDVPLLVGTFGKAFGSFGAFVAGPGTLIEYLMQKARPYIYTTALPQPVAAATRAAIALALREPWRRERVSALTQRFRAGCEREGIALSASATPIQPILTGSSARAVSLQQALMGAGFLVSAIRPPTVPANTSRLRITFSASHSEQDVDALVAALAETLYRDTLSA